MASSAPSDARSKDAEAAASSSASSVNRAALFERSKARRPIRIHDTRATLVTIALANGKTETWVRITTAPACSP